MDYQNVKHMFDFFFGSGILCRPLVYALIA